MSKVPKIHPVILAAGGSRRLSFPKQSAEFDGHTALELAVRNCAWLGTPLVVLGNDAAALRRRVPQGVGVVINRKWRRGMLSSLLAGLRRVPHGADFLLYPVDYPLLTERMLRRLVEGFRRRGPGQH
ncbi:MAG: nucleotidyltransferase family protein, partial [Terriglobales bacterium]